MSMSWSTFWRRPEEKKLDCGGRLNCDTESELAGGERMILCGYWYCAASNDWRTRVDWRNASKTCSRSSNRESAVIPPSWLNWVEVKIVISPDMNRRNAVESSASNWAVASTHFCSL